MYNNQNAGFGPKHGRAAQDDEKPTMGTGIVNDDEFDEEPGNDAGSTGNSDDDFMEDDENADDTGVMEEDEEQEETGSGE